MTKPEAFLWFVQTAVITNAVQVGTGQPVSDLARVGTSVTAVLAVLEEALWASERIPDELSAFEAAHEFCHHMINPSITPRGIPIWYDRRRPRR
jgi:hypothetical protein